MFRVMKSDFLSSTVLMRLARHFGTALSKISKGYSSNVVLIICEVCTVTAKSSLVSANSRIIFLNSSHFGREEILFLPSRQFFQKVLLTLRLGKWFKRTGKRNDIFLATKFGFVKGSKDYQIDSSGEFCKKACDESLKLLGIDSIDLCKQSASFPLQSHLLTKIQTTCIMPIQRHLSRRQCGPWRS